MYQERAIKNKQINKAYKYMHANFKNQIFKKMYIDFVNLLFYTVLNQKSNKYYIRLTTQDFNIRLSQTVYIFLFSFFLMYFTCLPD